MKQYTTPEQTAKLIELGFAPKMRIKGVCTKYGTVNVEHEAYFGVCELIEMLPEVLAPSNNDDYEIPLSISTDSFMWTVEYHGYYFSPYASASIELIDALYNMIIKLKEEGVI